MHMRKQINIVSHARSRVRKLSSPDAVRDLALTHSVALFCQSLKLKHCHACHNPHTMAQGLPEHLYQHRKRHRSPGLHTVVSDPELGESCDDFRTNKRHISEFMASDLTRHMSLASASSGDPDQSMSAEGTSQTPVSLVRTSTPPLPGSIRQQSSSLGRAASCGGVVGASLRLSHSNDHLDDNDWQTAGMCVSETSMVTPRTSIDEQQNTSREKSPGPTGLRLPSPALQNGNLQQNIPCNSTWYGPGVAQLPATGMLQNTTDPKQPETATSARADTQTSVFRTLCTRAKAGSDSMLRSISAGITLPDQNLGPPITAPVPLSARVKQSSCLQKATLLTQPQELMPPSPSDARFTFADLRKTALLRSLKQRATEDSSAQMLTDLQDANVTIADSITARATSTSPREMPEECMPGTRISNSGNSIAGGPHLPIQLAMLRSSEGGGIGNTLGMPSSLTVATNGMQALTGDTGPPPRTSFSGNLPPLPPSFPQVHTAQYSQHHQHHHQHHHHHGRPVLPARRASPSEGSWMDTCDSDSSDSSSCSEEEVARRNAPVSLRAEGIAPLPHSFARFQDHLLQSPAPYRIATAGLNESVYGNVTFPGFSDLDNMQGSPGSLMVSNSPAVGTPAPAYTIGAHIAAAQAAQQINSCSNRLVAIPESGEPAAVPSMMQTAL